MSERKSQWELFLEEEENPGPKKKRCPHCKEYKDVATEFVRAKDRPSGITSWCKVCRRPKRKHRDANDLFWKHFWERVERVDKCLVWRGRIVGRVPSCVRNKKNANVRRLVYRLACGELSDNDIVIMTCKTRHCVSQYHMKLGTWEDVHVKRANSMPIGENHYTHRRPETLRLGERNPAARLSEDDVRTIRMQHKQHSTPYPLLARRFGVSVSNIYQIVNNKTWKHVDA